MNKLLLIVLILIVSCGSEKKGKNVSFVESENGGDSQIEISERTNFDIDTVLKYDLNYLKSNTVIVDSKIDLRGFKNNNIDNYVPTDFVIKFLASRKIKGTYTKELYADHSKAFSFYQFAEYSKFNLLTFTYKDESCCIYLYGVSLEKGDDINVLDIGQITYSGADGGWIGEQYGEWNDGYSIDLVEISEYYEDFDERTNNTERDTLWSEFNIDKQGFFEYKKIDSVSYVGNKKQEILPPEIRPGFSSKSYSFNDLQIVLEQDKKQDITQVCNAKLTVYKDGTVTDEYKAQTESVGSGQGISSPNYTNNHIIFVKHGGYDGRTILVNKNGQVINVTGGLNFYDEKGKKLILQSTSDIVGISVFDLESEKLLLEVSDLDFQPISFHKYQDQFLVKCMSFRDMNEITVREINVEKENLVETKVDPNVLTKVNELLELKNSNLDCVCER